MKILILNGSPKGQYSITYHSCLYMEALHPEHDFQVLHVGQRIRHYEKDMSEALAAIQEADLLLFSYPVYTFIVPYQLHHFMELLKESGIDLKGKFATQISTSKHFYDVTAHRFIQDNCTDLGLRYIKGLSADMDDLTKEQGQKDVRLFFDYVQHCMKEGIWESPSVLGPSKALPYAAQLTPVQRKAGKETVIVTDLLPEDKALSQLIQDFQAAYPYPTRIVNLRDYPFAGGCISCFHCAADGTCVYKDGFDRFLREEIQTADSIVYAYTVKDHSMGSRFKLYDDRQFCNGHRTVTMGMPIGYLVCGDLSREENLRTIMEARCEVGHNFYCGAAATAEEVIAMARRMTYALENGYLQPQNFYGVGGMKIFRDLIYLMRGLMKADHQFYKKHGIYDFPQKKKGTLIFMMLVGAMMNNPKLRGKMGNQLSEGMIAPYKKVLENVKKTK